MNFMARTALLLPNEQQVLLHTLQLRFVQNMPRHPQLHWPEIEARLLAQPDKLLSLAAMEETGGEPDVIEEEQQAARVLFFDCAKESPSGRRNLCYDRQALEARKAHKPAQSAVEVAVSMGIELLTQAQYLQLQQFGAFDSKTSSWLHTPLAIRRLGGALFGDRRYDHVFIYHNGADAYYKVRGFRGCLQV